MKQDGGWRCSLFITILDRRGPPQFITILHGGPSIYVTKVESGLSSHTWVESAINGQPNSKRLAYFLTNEIQNIKYKDSPHGVSFQSNCLQHYIRKAYCTRQKNLTLLDHVAAGVRFVPI